MYIYYSSDFQCPDTGVPVHFLWDSELCAITAEIADRLYSEDDEFYNAEIAKETEEWCRRFYKYAEDLDEANDIAEKYDCWF